MHSFTSMGLLGGSSYMHTTRLLFRRKLNEACEKTRKRSKMNEQKRAPIPNLIAPKTLLSFPASAKMKMIEINTYFRRLPIQSVVVIITIMRLIAQQWMRTCEEWMRWWRWSRYWWSRWWSLYYFISNEMIKGAFFPFFPSSFCIQLTLLPEREEKKAEDLSIGKRILKSATAFLLFFVYKFDRLLSNLTCLRCRKENNFLLPKTKLLCNMHTNCSHSIIFRTQKQENNFNQKKCRNSFLPS